MPRAVVRRLGTVLLVVGCATRGWVASLEGPVDATADDVPACVAGDGCRPSRVVSAAVLCGLSYPFALWLSVMLGIYVGLAPLALNGGHVDYDGLPVFLTGPISAVFVVAFVAWGSGWWDPAPSRRVPSGSPTPEEGALR
jgi:presenilin-like A22 family membrane protease